MLGTLSDSDSDSGPGLDSKTLVWVIIPLIIVLGGAIFITIFYRRRRRIRHPELHQRSLFDSDRILTPGGHLVYSAGGRRNRHGRWAPWSGMRSAEGLNELGEAPPPYKQNHEEEDVELGTRLPPGYDMPAQPSPAVVRGASSEHREHAGQGADSRRSSDQRQAESSMGIAEGAEQTNETRTEGTAGAVAAGPSSEDRAGSFTDVDLDAPTASSTQTSPTSHHEPRRSAEGSRT